MTTETWSSRLRHDSDAMFREWGSEFNAKLAVIGLVQTSDTGQINWATVTRAGTNSNAGYEIWRFDDALQATAPIFIRFDFGTASSASAPRILVSVGTGTNGAGTLTGTALTSSTFMCVNNSTAHTSDSSVPSYFCFKDGHLGLIWKATGTTTSASQGRGGLFLISRSVDSSGAPTAKSAQVVWGSGSTGAVQATQALRFAATAAAYTAQTAGIPAQTMLGFLAQSQSSSIIGSDIQVALGFTWTPRMEPLLAPCGALTADVSEAATFTATLIGSTPRTYLRAPAICGPFGPITSNNTGGLSFAILWE